MSPADLLLWPDAAPVLLVAPVAWVAWLLLDRVRGLRLRRLAGPRAVALADLCPRRRGLRRTLNAVALGLAAVAVLQPVWGEALRPVARRGVDLLICLDVSRSMLARDVPPSRLEYARQEIRALAERVDGDRFGLVAFAGAARLAVPLTRDTASFAALVAEAGPLSVRRGGTDLGAALSAALVAFRGRSGRHEVVILVTDGEDLEARGLQVARECRERGIAVHCVGFGSVLGSKIAVEGAAGEEFLRDRSGREVVSAMDPGGLRAIAERTGGEFVDAATRPRPLADLYERNVERMARRSYEAEARRERQNRYQWPLLAAFLLWLAELLVSERRRP